MKIHNFLVKTPNEKDTEGDTLNVEACICLHRELLYLTFGFYNHDKP